MKQLSMENMMRYFFLVGHMQYAWYLTQYLLETHALNALDAKSNHVFWHNDEYWNTVSADQFGEKTAVKIGKVAFKSRILSAELVYEWINAFPINVHIRLCES